MPKPTIKQQEIRELIIDSQSFFKKNASVQGFCTEGFYLWICKAFFMLAKRRFYIIKKFCLTLKFKKMKNVENYGVKELERKKLQEIKGGGAGPFWWPAMIRAMILPRTMVCNKATMFYT